MAYPSKFRDAYLTSVRLEKKTKKIADSLDIILSDALRIGLNVMIKTKIADHHPAVTPDLLNEFLEVERMDLIDLQAYIHLKKEEQATLDNIIEMQKEAQKGDKIIEVYDDTQEEYVRIRESEFNPLIHEVKV